MPLFTHINRWSNALRLMFTLIFPTECGTKYRFDLMSSRNVISFKSYILLV